MSGVIGTPRRRVDGRAKVTAQTRFADDVILPRMVHCRLLRATVPHARILRIDSARAAAHPGVHLVLTGESFPIPYSVLPVSHDEHALCRDKVRFVGDPVAAVIARDEATAAEDLGPQFTARKHTIAIHGYAGVNDAAASEKAFQGLLEAAVTALGADRKLSQTARHSEPVQVRAVDFRIFSNVLCHHAELTLVVEDKPA